MSAELNFLRSAQVITEPLIDLLNSGDLQQNGFSDQQIAEFGLLIYYIRYNARKGRHYRCLETWLLFLVKFGRVNDLRKQLRYLDPLLSRYKCQRLNTRLRESSDHFQQQIDRWIRHRITSADLSRCRYLVQDDVKDDWNFVAHEPLPLRITGKGRSPKPMWVAQLMPYENHRVVRDLNAIDGRLDNAQKEEWRQSILKDLVLPSQVSAALDRGVDVRELLVSAFRWSHNNVTSYRELRVRAGEPIGDDSSAAPPWSTSFSAPVDLTADQQSELDSMEAPEPPKDDLNSYLAQAEIEAAERCREDQVAIRGSALQTRNVRPKFVTADVTSKTRETLERDWRKLRLRSLVSTSIEKPHTFSDAKAAAFIFGGATPVRLLRSRLDKNGRERVSLVLRYGLEDDGVFAQTSRTLFNTVATTAQVRAATTCEQVFADGIDTFVPALCLMSRKLDKKEKISVMTFRQSTISVKTLAGQVSAEELDLIKTHLSTRADQRVLQREFDDIRARKAARTGWKLCKDNTALVGYVHATALKQEAYK